MLRTVIYVELLLHFKTYYSITPIISNTMKMLATLTSISMLDVSHNENEGVLSLNFGTIETKTFLIQYNIPCHCLSTKYNMKINIRATN